MDYQACAGRLRLAKADADRGRAHTAEDTLGKNAATGATDCNIMRHAGRRPRPAAGPSARRKRTRQAVAATGIRSEGNAASNTTPPRVGHLQITRMTSQGGKSTWKLPSDKFMQLRWPPAVLSEVVTCNCVQDPGGTRDQRPQTFRSRAQLSSGPPTTAPPMTSGNARFLLLWSKAPVRPSSSSFMAWYS